MTLTDLLPVRFTIFDRTPRQPKHSAPAEVERLRLRLKWADLRIKAQCVQLDDTAAKQAEAEELVVQQQADMDELTVERDHWRDEALALKARFSAQLAADANAHRITVPPAIRPVDSPEDQATGPIDCREVQALWEARDAGLLGPVTNPGQLAAP